MSTWSTPAALLGLSCTLFLGSCEQTAQCPDGTTLDAQGHCVRLPSAGLLRLPESADDECSGVESLGIPDAQCTSTFDGDVHFETEDEMAGFCAEYDCVSGGVTVGSTETTDDIDNNTQITSLAPLSCLKTSRFLYVGKTAGQFTKLELPQYVMSNGGMNITRTVGMTEISLPELLYVGGDLSIQNNLLLTTFSMASLRHVGEFFIVTNNASLPPETARELRTQFCPTPPTSTTLVNNGHGAGVDDELQDLVLRASRTTQFHGDGIGTIFVTIIDVTLGAGHKAIIARGTFDDVDFSGPAGEEQALVVVGVPVTGNEYLVTAFLDDDGSGGGGGATSGDLVTSLPASVLLTSEAPGDLSIQFDQSYP